MQLHINTMNGDILENSTKNVFNDKAIILLKEKISNLVIEIEKSSIENKESIIEEIKNNSDNPSKMKNYLENLSNVTTIPSNILTMMNGIFG